MAVQEVDLDRLAFGMHPHLALPCSTRLWPAPGACFPAPAPFPTRCCLHLCRRRTRPLHVSPLRLHRYLLKRGSLRSFLLSLLVARTHTVQPHFMFGPSTNAYTPAYYGPCRLLPVQCHLSVTVTSDTGVSDRPPRIRTAPFLSCIRRNLLPRPLATSDLVVSRQLVQL